MPAAATALKIVAGSFSLANWRGDTLTATRYPGPNRAIVAQAVRMIHSPIGTIRFDSSAIGMNFDGLMIASPPCCQRISASKPLMRSLPTFTIGWYSSFSSSFASASRSASSIALRSLAWLCIASA